MSLAQRDVCACEVAIAGGGMVGMTLAIALAEVGLETIVIDALPPHEGAAPAFDGRVSAIAAASRKLLGSLGIWAKLADQAEPIRDILVSDGRLSTGASPALLHFDHTELGAEPLGHIVENRHIRGALYARAAEIPRLQVFAPAQVLSLVRGTSRNTLALQDGRQIEARLCVAAEGRNSPLRRAAGVKTFGWSYGQTGIVATVAHERPHQGWAQEYFLPSGPFAILPMTGNRSSLVWTERTALAPAFMALDEASFNAEVARRFGPYLGPTRVAGARWSYPLSLQLARDYVLPRFALAGDAAHTIHPIAGQGLNLGLRDVAALAEAITDAARLGRDIGALDVLDRYQRWRRFDTVTLAAATDALNRLFSNDIAPLRLARDLGLGLANQLGPMRRFLMRQAGGSTGLLPRLLRGEPL